MVMLMFFFLRRNATRRKTLEATSNGAESNKNKKLADGLSKGCCLPAFGLQQFTLRKDTNHLSQECVLVSAAMSTTQPP